jgi:hypothetical protein
MNRAALFVALLLAASAPEPPQPAIAYFSNIRTVQVAQPERQNFFIVDEEIWSHARADLGDLRLYDAEAPVQYALSEQRAGISSEEVDAKMLNLGSVGGHTEFDLDAGSLPEYDRVRLRLDAHDFVATASVSGGAATGKAADVVLAPSTLYDFTKEQLGSNSQLKLPRSSFRYLHVRLSPGIRPQQVRGATIYNLHEQLASWTKVGSCSPPQSKERKTLITCDVPEKVPLSRVLFHIAPAQINFRRTVSIEDSKGVQIASGEISRVRVNRAGTQVTAEDLAVNVSVNSPRLLLVIDNGDNPALDITVAEPLSLERRVYFDPQGKSALSLYYGDERLSAPVYDYARFFHLEPLPAQAQLGPGAHNAQYTGRPDDRPWSERHTIVLWAAMLVAVLALAFLAVRGLRTEGPR